MDSKSNNSLLKFRKESSNDSTIKRKHIMITNETTDHNEKDKIKKYKSDDSDENYEIYDSEYEDFKNHCKRVDVPDTLPECTLCKHCGKEGVACSRMRLGKYTLKRTVAIKKCFGWEELYFEYASIYYEASELTSYYDNRSKYKPKYIDIQKEKESGDCEAGWLPQCMEELFYAFKYFDMDNSHKKKYKWGKKGLKLFLNKYDIDNKMI